MREKKDSGIEWIGEIPKEWETQKAKWIFKERNEKGNSIILQLLSPSQKYGVIPQSELDSVVKVKEDTDLSTFKTIHAGDYCISLRSFQGGFEYSKYEGVVSPAYHVFYANGKICDLYYKFLFKCVGFIEKIASLPLTLRDGKNISFDMFGDMLIPMPPLCNQENISAYLDNKCTKIDSIIEKQEKVIEKLKEYKLSVITEAVTKGLNPDVKMKDSGVEWIGEINSHYKFTKIGLLCFVTKLAGFEYTDTMVQNIVSDEGDVPIVRAQNIKMFKFKKETINEYIGLDTSILLNRCALDKKAVLITFIGAGIGDVCIIDEPKRFHLAPNVAKIEVRNDFKNLLSEEYLMYYIGSYAGKGEIFKISKASAQPSLSMETIRGIQIVLPPISEQHQIVDYLDKKCSAIDSAIEKKQAIIEKLKEYKKSLIYEVVTGKREV